MIMHWVLLAWCSMVAFLLGGAFAMWAERKRRQRQREDAAAQDRRLLGVIAKYMQSGTTFHSAIMKLMEARHDVRTSVNVDWDLLRNAANGAGFTLVKDAAPRVGAKVN